MPPVHPPRFAVTVLVALLAACGGSGKPSATGATAADAQPPLPAAAVDLLPGAFNSAVRVDVAGLRKSALWGYGQQVARAECVDLGKYTALLDHTDVLVGGASDEGESKGAAVFQGRLDAADLDTLFNLFAGQGAALPPATRETRGRFEVVERAPLAGSALGQGYAVMGDRPSVMSLLDVADAKAPTAKDGVLSGELRQAIGFDTAGVAVVYQPSAKGREELTRRLGRGARSALPPGLLDGSRGALALHLGDPLELRAAVESSTPEAAAALTNNTQASLMQLNLLLRLAGLPPLLESVVAQTQGQLSVFSLKLAQADLDALWSRLAELLAAEGSDCGEVAL